MRILSFEKNKQGYLLVLEDYRELQFDDDAFYEYAIYGDVENMDISNERVLELEQAYEKSLIRIIKKYAFTLLSRRVYTVGELKKKLVLKFDSERYVDQVINQLVDEKYLDDNNFASNYIEYRKKYKPESERMIKYKLQMKGIDNKIVDDCIEDLQFSEYNNAKKLYEKRYLKLMNDNNQMEIKRRAYGYLARKGYKSEIIRKVLELSLDNIDE